MGKTNRLVILRDTDHGQILDGGSELGDVLLPIRYVDEERGLEAGDEIEIFLYRDSEDRPVATTEVPKVEVGDMATLEVIDTTQVGAFLDWGLMKDLFLPFSNQRGRPQVGEKVLVQVLHDPVTGRIVATQKIAASKDGEFPTYQRGEKVSVLVGSRSELGWSVVIEGNFLGMIYENEVFQAIREGDEIDAYVNFIREDARIDLQLEPIGYASVPPLGKRIIAKLEREGGVLALHDKSPPAEIEAAFSCSKKQFKKALGALYKGGKIRLVKGGVELVGE